MKVLLTGGRGFIGRNLRVRLQAMAGIEVVCHAHDEPLEKLAARVAASDFIFHLAGVNRPPVESDFASGNAGLTASLCDAVRASGRAIPVLYTSSIQAERDNPYGTSKRQAEQALLDLARDCAAPVFLYRLPNVFGKWARPEYNSAVATFCHHIAHGLPIQVHDASAEVTLVYVDDVVDDFIQAMEQRPEAGYRQVRPEYRITVGELAGLLHRFKESRNSLMTEAVGEGLTRALYSTFISYYEPQQFAYPLAKHEDPRGTFVEMLKTRDSGQFSFFTAHPGVTRGGHYHHSKTEKFLVIQGKARFRFRHVETGASHELRVSGEQPEVVETVPGWAHDITNIGDDQMIVMLWANEVFDRQHPDTISYEVQP